MKSFIFFLLLLITLFAIVHAQRGPFNPAPIYTPYYSGVPGPSQLTGNQPLPKAAISGVEPSSSNQPANGLPQTPAASSLTTNGPTFSQSDSLPASTPSASPTTPLSATPAPLVTPTLATSL
ncbi:2471_t:CDS:2 [Paraglomus brasilianum]|uniref:2471_t:CDS:1 n=1 Tax=Paraglomus brasilianum TaxID=144538 RepID=A0A9N9A8D9_9GLOM|nr:2471_t:CDS:2 [Paraglomus brasilianum]